ncbi:unnamed protein product [Schistocephalus solidus]|uniref:Transmembrane protein n=1 Tax=Schistocephalus solidus TaxID=70667 RepID=A0A183SUS0_SCHSO|nr:unnamed protein product [Schistocephalus solidus]
MVNGESSVEQIYLFCSWLFMSFGFCMSIICFPCMSHTKYCAFRPAATDSFLYGLLFGIFASLEGVESAIAFDGEPGPLIFGLMGLILVQVESAEASDTKDTDDIVFLI